MIMILFVAIGVVPASAEDPSWMTTRVSSSVRAGFIQNTGQVVDQHGRPRKDLLYLFHGSGLNVHLKERGFSYELYSISREQGRASEATGASPGDPRAHPAARSTLPRLMRFHRIDIELIGASRSAEVLHGEQLPGQFNYFNASLPEAGVRSVRSYGRVVYRGIWPNIDLVFRVVADDSASVGGAPFVQYEFLLHPGARLSDIRLKYSGMEGQSAGPDWMTYASSLGTITESGLRAFELGDAERRSVPVRFDLDEGILSFRAEAYDERRPFLIDPSILWATYYGGTDVEAVTSVTTDANNNIYVTGSTVSTNAIATTGTHQSAIAGLTDAFIAKFSASGVRQWATYYGGTSSDQGLAIAALSGGNVAVVGMTESSAGIATTVGMHQIVYGGGGDGFMAVFDPNGARLWGTYYGGNGFESCNAVASNNNGIFAVAGETSSLTGIASSGAHQATHAGGGFDAFVTAFSFGGTRQFATYYGGPGEDRALGVGLTNGGVLSVCGVTASASGIATTGSHQPAIGGSQDAFAVVFDYLGTLQWGTYYGGTGSESGRDISSDGLGNIIMAGSTTSLTGIATTGVHQAAYGGNGDAFLVRFSSSGARSWGTYFGGFDDDAAISIVVENTNEILLTGFTQSTTGIATNGLPQVINAGGYDAMIAKFTPAGARLWGTYYGGGAGDFGYAITLDTQSNAIIGGMTASPSGIATPGSHQPLFGGGSNDGFILKMTAGSVVTSIAVTAVSPDTLCAGDIVSVTYTTTGSFGSGNTFTAQLSNASGSFSPPVSIGQLFGNVPGTIVGVIPPNTPFGTKYRIRVVSDSPPATGSDNGYDLVVLAKPNATINVTGSTLICTGDSVMLCGIIGSNLTYQWNLNGVPIPGATSICHAARANGAYTLSVTAHNRCTAVSQPVNVALRPSPPAVLTPPGPVRLCLGDSVTLNANAGYRYSYEWYKDSVLVHVVGDSRFVVGETGSYFVRVIDTSGCSTRSNSVLVIVEAIMVPVISPVGAVTLCEGDTLRLRTRNYAGYTFEWRKDGVLVPGAVDTALIVTSSGEYRVTIVRGGCSESSLPVLVTVVKNPTVTVSAAGKPTTICEGDSVMLTAQATGTVSYRWYFDDVEIPGATQPSLAATRAGMYAVRVVDANKCSSAKDSIRVSVKPRPPVVLRALGNTQFCEGGSVTLEASSDTGVVYEWLHNGSPIPGASSPSYSASKSGRYVVHVRNAAGCVGVSISITVTVLARPNADISGPSTVLVCDGDRTILRTEKNASYVYAWLKDGVLLPGETRDSLVVTVPGRYVAIVTQSGCADSSDAITVSWAPPVRLSVSGPTSVCINSTAVYRCAPGRPSQIQWSVTGGRMLSVAINDSARIEWTTPGTGGISVHVTDDSSGCARDTTIEVRVASTLSPVITASPGTRICAGDSVVLDAGNGYATYQWSTGDNTTSIIVRQPGRYTVTVTDANGCSGSSTPVDLAVSEKPLPRLVVSGPRDFCEGDSVTLSLPGIYRSVTWSGGTNSAVLTVRQSGMFHASVIDTNGCPGMSDTIIVVVHPFPQPSISVTGDLELCPGDSVVLDAGAGYARYRWTTGDTTRSIVLRQGGTYGVRVTTVDGCAADASPVAAVSRALPSSPIIGPNSLCTDAPAGYEVDRLPGVSYRWSCARGTMLTDDTSHNVSIRWASVGKDTVMLRVSNGKCDKQLILAVDISSTLRPLLQLSGSPRLCRGDSLMLSAPSGYSAYRWSTGDTMRNITIRSAGSYYTYVETSNGCNGHSDTVDISIVDPPVPRIHPDSLIALCFGDSVMFDAGAGYRSYRWSDGSIGRYLTTKRPGTYAVTVVSLEGCPGSSIPVEVTVRPEIMARLQASGPLSFCEGDSVSLQVDRVFTSYAWNEGSRSRTVTVRSAGDFWATVTDVNGCAAVTDTLTVVVFPAPAKPVITRGDDTLFSTAATSYQWHKDGIQMTGQTSRTLLHTGPGRYRVAITDVNGCANVSDPFIIDGIQRSMTLRLPVIEASPGDTVGIAFTVVGGQVPSSPPMTCRAVLAFDRSILMPLSLSWRDSADFRFAEFRGSNAEPLAARFLVMLGASDSTRVEPLDFHWSDSTIEVDVEAGLVRIRVCREGGERLFDGSSRTTLFQNRPNPFNNETVIEFEVAETGFTELIILDMLGRRVSTLISTTLARGRHQCILDAASLASGTYRAVLLTPTAVRHRTMQLMK